MLWTTGERSPANWGKPGDPTPARGLPVDDGGSSADELIPSHLRRREFSPIPNPYNNNEEIF